MAAFRRALLGSILLNEGMPVTRPVHSDMKKEMKPPLKIKDTGKRNRYWTAYHITKAIWKNEPDAYNTKYVKVIAFSKKNKRDGTVYSKSRTKTLIPGERQRTYAQIVTCQPNGYTGRISDAPGLKLTCNCPRFKYKWEYALWSKGIADIIHSNGEFPEITNPGLKVGACKHILRVLQFALAKKL